MKTASVSKPYGVSVAVCTDVRGTARADAEKHRRGTTCIRARRMPSVSTPVCILFVPLLAPFLSRVLSVCIIPIYNP